MVSMREEKNDKQQQQTNGDLNNKSNYYLIQFDDTVDLDDENSTSSTIS